MKKLMLILVVAAASAFLTSCGTSGCCGASYNSCSGADSIGNWY